MIGRHERDRLISLYGSATASRRALVKAVIGLIVVAVIAALGLANDGENQLATPIFHGTNS